MGSKWKYEKGASGKEIICIYAKIAIMNKKEVENVIRGQFRQHFQIHPEAIPADITDAILIARETAFGYWENRTDAEIKRDYSAKVTVGEYEVWMIDELSQFNKSTILN